LTGTQDTFVSWFNVLLERIGQVIKGKPDKIALCLVAMLAEGHILLEDVPGTGKTSLARTIAAAIRGSSNRVQFTPDLLPSDVTGGLIYDQASSRFDFRRGPVFANLVLADEINRASPKTQSALLQVMEERQVSVDITTHDVPTPFMIIATQNPIEQEGTYRLPEAQLDRFLMKLSLGYMSHDAEIEMLRSVGGGMKPESIDPVLDVRGVQEMITHVRQVQVEDPVRSYIVRLCDATRSMPELRLGVSSRGAVGLMQAGRALAATQGRAYVNVDDVKLLAPAVMAHRMLLSLESELNGVSAADLVARVLDTVETPQPARRGGGVRA